MQEESPRSECLSLAAISQALSQPEQLMFAALPDEQRQSLELLPAAEGRLWLHILIEALRSRYTMPDLEMLLMVESLKSFPLEKVQRAFEYIRRHPPEGYKGMPGETDVIAAIRHLDEVDAKEFKRAREAEVVEELRGLAARREAGEQFYSWVDVLRDATKELGRDPIAALAMPEPSPLPSPPTEDEFEEGRKRTDQMLQELKLRYPNTGNV